MATVTVGSTMPSDDDGDGIANVVDGMPGDVGDATDSDRDGISDIVEGVEAGTDTDNDGIPDYLDLDSDNDGIPDQLETAVDADNDGIGNWRDTDSDNDGIDDADEADAIPPLSNNDADGDGLPDEIDVDNTGGTDANGNGVDDAFEPNDTDADGLPDYLDTDSDDDGIPDILETTVDSDGDATGDWRDTDSDNDGIDDVVEADNVPALTGTDSDGDGIDDALDVDATGGTDADADGIDDATQPRDTDGDGMPDYLDEDSDDDGIPDAIEGTVDTDGDGDGNWRDTDSDDDGYSDEDEGNVDTDNDGQADYVDTDSDNDGIPDSADNGDKDGDGIPDRIDTDEGRLETAVRGSGSFGILSLLALLALSMGIAAKRRHTGVLLVMLCVALPLATTEQAAADNHVCGESNGEFEGCWYAGAGLGLTYVAPEGQAGGWSTSDDQDSGWKLYGGYQFKRLWSAELSYVDGGAASLGNVDPALEALIPGASIDYSTPSLMAVRWLKDRNASTNAFLKLGVSFIDNNASDSRIPYEKQTDVQLAAGLGAQFKFAERWFLRGDVDFYDRDHYYAGVSLGASFGGAGQSVPEPRAYEPAPVAEKPPTPVAKAAVVAPPPPAPKPVCEELVRTLEGVTFETNSDRLTLNARRVLDIVARDLQASPGDSVQLLAHTDSQGAADYNLGLSVRRAKSAGDYLISRGIAEDRLTSRGLGETQPIADNGTAEGRALNRRVELIWTTENCR